MGVKGVIELKGLHPEAALKELRPAVKQANAQVILHWHKSYLPGHFVESAYQRYRYQSRDSRYRQRKYRRYRHYKPLVLTGELRDAATTQVRVTATSKRGRGTLPGTQKANFRRSASSPNLREEMLRTTRAEERAMARFHEQQAVEHMKQTKHHDRRIPV